MNKKETSSTKDWIMLDYIYKDGTIKLKNGDYIKIIKIEPINFNLKTDLEKESILNSYKIFLKTCNFNLQILIQSNKEDLSKIINKIQNQKIKNNKIKIIANSYIEFIKKVNKDKKSASRNFYIIIKEKINEEAEDNTEEIIKYKLNEKYLKIKECLNRCGNRVENCEKKEVYNILFSFFNSRIYFNQI